MTEQPRQQAVISPETKAFLVGWINGVIRTKYLQISSLDQLATGVTFCQLLNVLHPNRVQLAKVYIRPKSEFEIEQNFKLLAAAFQKIGLKQIDVGKMVKGRYPDLLGLLLYLKKLLDDKQQVQPQPDYRKLAVTEHSQQKSRNASPNRYTMRPSNDRNESPLRYSTKEKGKFAIRKVKTELERRQQQLQQVRSLLIKKLDRLSQTAQSYQGNSLDELKKQLLNIIDEN